MRFLWMLIIVVSSPAFAQEDSWWLEGYPPLKDDLELVEDFLTTDEFARLQGEIYEFVDFEGSFARLSLGPEQTVRWSWLFDEEVHFNTCRKGTWYTQSEHRVCFSFEGVDKDMCWQFLHSEPHTHARDVGRPGATFEWKNESWLVPVDKNEDLCHSVKGPKDAREIFGDR